MNYQPQTYATGDCPTWLLVIVCILIGYNTVMVSLLWIDSVTHYRNQLVEKFFLLHDRIYRRFFNG